MASRTTIEIYTRQRTLLHSVESASIGYCPQCDAEVLMIGADNAAAILQLTPAAIAELCSSGALHLVATASGAPLICCSSLLALTNKSEPKTQIEHL